MTDSNTKKTAIFDLGNVVLDWDIDRILGSLGISKLEQRVLRDELFSHQDWVDMDHGKKKESEVLSRVSERTTLNSEIIERALLAAKTSLATIPETIELMHDIRTQGKKMICVSNMSVETYEHIKNRDFFSMFSGIVISGIEGCMKPNKEIFQLTLRRFELEPNTALFIDDSLRNIKTAREVGFTSLHFRRTKNCYSEIRRMLF